MKNNKNEILEIRAKIKKILGNCKSEKKAISMQDLALNVDISQRLLRKQILELRRTNLFYPYFLVSNENGYWLSKKVEDIEAWLKNFTSKAFSILKTSKKAIKLCSHKKQTEMLNLFTDLINSEE